METPARIADALHELPLDETVNVFVRTRHGGRIAPSLLEDGFEPFFDRRRILFRQHAAGGKRFSPREAAGDIILEQRAVEPERNAEIERSGIGLRVEAAGPECHEC